MDKIVVLGAGESGIGAAVLAKKQGFEVFVSDFGKIKDNYRDLLEKYGLEYEQGGHTESKILEAKEVIKSPGIRDDAPIIKKIVAKNIPVISEIEFAGRYTNAKMICITGSNGKTTTTELTYKILKDAGLNVAIGGNVGRSFAMQVAEDKPFDYYVLELSSFQLDNMYNFRADVAILMNVTPDHLDRYEFKMQNYTNSKFRITQNQGKNDVFIYFNDDPISAEEVKKRTFNQQVWAFSVKEELKLGAYFLDNGNLEVRLPEHHDSISPEGFQLAGKHNHCNIMAAVLTALYLGIPVDKIKQSVDSFQPIEHRIEPAGVVDGVTYINDSKATNVDAVYYALDAMKTKVVLILGGVDKGNDYSQLDNLVKEKVRAIVAMGVDNKAIHAAFDSMVDIYDTKSMSECLKKCREIAKSGDTVLLSPACASFDLFTCYEDRGEQFKNQVKEMM